VGDDALINAAGRIADGEQVDWASITSSLPSDSDRQLAEELAIVAQIAAGHRQLHQLLPIAPDTPASLVPDRARWGHLDLLNIVGRGSYGVVYRAWDTRLERLVALKLFHGASNPDAVMEEGRMLARVRHENVVAVYGADVIDGVAGIWMELVHGRTLDNIVKSNGPLNAHDAAAVGIDIAKALGAVHAAGLLHCDVKAQNVVRESGGRVVLMDFGAGSLAPEMRDEDQRFDVAGTPRYMAPELFAAGATATRASDIYSLGVLLYFAVSGKYPLAGNTLGELRRAHEAQQFHPLREVHGSLPRAFLDAVDKATERNPAQRLESAAAIQSMLAPVAAAEPIQPKTTRSFGRWAILSAVGVVLLAILVAWLVGLTRPAGPGPSSLAVLPIRNLTGDPGKQHLADGLSEALITQLSRVPGLDVASSSRVASVRGSREFEREIAELLGVRLLLTGSIVQADNRIRIHVMLNDPRAGRTIAGTEIERASADVLTARSEIAKWVAARLELPVPSGQDEK
jgi:serine/threonine protein kinase